VLTRHAGLTLFLTRAATTDREEAKRRISRCAAHDAVVRRSGERHTYLPARRANAATRDKKE
jgi:hypothetical protein